MNKKKIALFDIDKTIYDGYIVFPLAEYFLKHNTINQDCVEKLYDDLGLYRAGKVNYENTVDNLNNNLAEGLKGIPLSLALKQVKAFLVKEKERSMFFSYTESTIRMLQKKRYDVYFVTGEPQFVGLATSKLFKVSGFISSEYETQKDILTGKIKKSLAYRKAKLKSVKDLLKGHVLEESFAFGDSEGDAEMLNFVNHAVCINPTDGLREMANKNEWIIAKPDEVEKIIIQRI